MTDQIVIEKTAQAIAILDELDIDCWLTFVRETTAMADPSLSLIYGHDLTWQSALIITRHGERIAIVGHFEAESAKSTGAYEQVIAYHQSIRQPLIETLKRINPRQIAVNYSEADTHADGLPVGLFKVLTGYLTDADLGDRLISAEQIVAKLRGQKTATEVLRVRQAVHTTEQIYQRTFHMLRPGMSEKQIGAYMHQLVDEMGLQTSWESAHCPAVNSGPDSPVGHAGPTDIILQPGHLVHFDFGVKENGYCSDIQRMVYLLRSDETSAPSEVQRAFDTVRTALEAARTALVPGARGVDVDSAARKIVIDAGYPEYMYGTGHHLGRTVHDGAGILGPAWERYGKTPFYTVESGHVYTLEPGIAVPGYGYIGLEEDVLVTDDGAICLGQPQTELILIKP